MSAGNVLIFGKSGMLGYAVTKYFTGAGYSVTGVSRAEFDIAKSTAADLERILDGRDLVINCAGVIKPRIAQLSIEEVLKVNAIFPRNLARRCDRMGIRCFHVTTDCVYSGKKGRYTELDPFDAEDVYGLSKNAGEPSECMVLRTSIIGEEEGQGRSLLAWAMSQKGKQVNGFTNHVWNGVTTVRLAKAIDTIVRQHRYSRGTFHLHSPGAVTKDVLLRLMSDAYNLGLSVNPAAAAEACDRSIASVHSLSADIITDELSVQLADMRSFFEGTSK
jgi:dTDP-4-dehydrorhamnose reductase